MKTEHAHIVQVNGVCGGEPVIDGLCVSVRHGVTQHQQGEAIVDIAEALGISEAQVFHALSYFFNHRDEIMAIIAREEQVATLHEQWVNLARRSAFACSWHEIRRAWVAGVGPCRVG